MIAIDPILDFLNLAIWTAVIEGEEPVSVVLVSESSGGKTSMLKKLICPITSFNTDLTTRDISNVIADKSKRVILLSDMQAIFVHKSTVVSMTLQGLRNLLEEGMYNDPFSGTKIHRRMSMIAGIPPREFHQYSGKFVSGGLDTRFLVFSYEYKKKTVLLIHDHIESGGYLVKTESKSMLNLPEDAEPRRILLGGEIARKCRDLAAALKRDEIGTRTHHHVRRMVMASAARANRNEAIMEDYNLVEQYSDFLDPNRENTKKI